MRIKIMCSSTAEIWPNPARTVLTIGHLQPDQPIHIEIFDATGHMKWNGIATYEITVDIRFWPSGLYVAILRPWKSDTRHSAPRTLKFLVR